MPRSPSSDDARRAAIACGAALLAVYLATLAPGVTLWDAGEFASAARTLGVPHPPGTPLYVLAARAWSLCLPVETAVATNMLSALATAAACAILAACVARWMTSVALGAAAGIGAGTVSAVWQSATETEVYAAALLLSMLMLLAGAHASEHGGRRGFALLVYLIGLSVPLHLSAIVAAPAAIALASLPASGWRLRWDWLVRGAGATIVAVGAAGASMPVIAIGLAMVVASALRGLSPDRRAGWLDALVAVLLLAVALSALTFFVVRAPHDPAINQGNPGTISAALDVIARRQYAVAGVRPRRAPLWLQLGNVVQYADWQVALGLDRAVGASWRRTPVTILFVLLGIGGSAAHRRADRRTWLAVLVLLASATIGVCVLLNLRAGPSFGYGVLPVDADREPRERDYFFALGFACWGAWAGIGAVALARRMLGARTGTVAGIVLASLPIALNWRALDRRREPEASIARTFAEALLRSAPPNAVLFVAGDNDSYPLWYAQQARGVRTDVTTVTVPLMGARWYRAELARRWALYAAPDTASWLGEGLEMRRIAERARMLGRPVAASVALSSRSRAAIGGGWAFHGLVFVREDTAGTRSRIDSAKVREAARLVGDVAHPGTAAGPYGDPAAGYVASLLACPEIALRASTARAGGAEPLLDSRCNYR